MRRPNRFVSLHNHANGSVFDAIGLPVDHFNWCVENGTMAHAITEHGHLNTFCHAWIAAEEMQKRGVPFRYLPGIEAYFHPDLTQWGRDKVEFEAAAADMKAAKKLAIERKEKVITEIVARVDGDDEADEMESVNALTIENEDDTKSIKKFNPVNRRHHLVMLPKDSIGLQQLFHLTSRSYLEGFFRFPRIDVKMMKEVLKDGHVIASSACVGGFVSWSIFRILEGYSFDNLTPTLLDDPAIMEKCVSAVGNVYDMMTDVFGRDNYYLELQFNKLGAQDVTNRAIIEFARRSGVTSQLNVTCDAHYYNPNVWKEREIYRKLAWLSYDKFTPDMLPKSVDDLKCELYPKNADQVWDEYLRSKDRNTFYDDEHDRIVFDAIERTHDIAYEVIRDPAPDKTSKFVQSLVPNDTSAIAHLTRMALEGLKKKGLDTNQVYVDRLKEELGVMKKLKCAEYFITMAKIMDLAREVVLVGPGRGSAPGSLVNYVLGITDLDPIRWELPFFRFVSLQRKELPDVDSDFSDRDKVLAVLRKQFGQHNVVPISNYNTMKLKSLVKDLSKFYGVPFDEVNAALRTVERDVRKAVTKHGDDKNLFILKLDEALEHSPPFRKFIEAHPDVAESIQVLLNQNRSLGRHAGGVIVGDNLPERLPLIVSKGEAQSPFVEGMNAKHLSPVMGEIKFDLLGLETLRLIERTIEYILQEEGLKRPRFVDVKRWFDENMHVDKIDLDDQKVYEYVYHDGRWASVFQCTSLGAQRFFMKSKPRSITDIAALTAVYRPGPLAAHVDKLWIDASQNCMEYDWGDKRINKLLEPTYGLLIFQEQVMLLAEEVGGFPKEKCDEVRRAIMKRTVSGNAAGKASMDTMKIEFIDGAEKKGYPRQVADDLYEKIRYFSGYSFNKSHSFSYAIDSFYCAWLLTHHEKHWLRAYLESMSGDPWSKSVASSQIKHMGYEIVPLDINNATASWTHIPEKKFMPSFMSCKGIGVAAIDEIIENRPYNTIEELLWNPDGAWRHSKFNKRALEAFIKTKALVSLDCVGDDRVFATWKHMHHVVIENMDKLKKTSKKDPHLGMKNFYELARDTRDQYTEEWSRRDFVSFQVDVYGSVDVNSIVDPGVLQKLHAKGVLQLDQVEVDTKEIAWFVGATMAIKQTKTKKAYGEISCLVPSGKIIKLKVWGLKPDFVFEPYGAYVAEVECNEWGCSTTSWRLKKLST